MTRPYEPSVLVCEEKHGTYYYDATTPEALQSSAFAILKERWEDGCWYYDPGERPQYEGLSEDRIEALPDPELREVARKKLTRFRSVYQVWKNEKSFYMGVKKIIEEERKSEAWKALGYRALHEYETVSLEPLRSAE